MKKFSRPAVLTVWLVTTLVGAGARAEDASGPDLKIGGYVKVDFMQGGS